MEPQRAVYRQRAPYSPYQNQNPAHTIGKKKYVINTPRPGVKADDFRGIETLCELKKVTVVPKRSMVEDVPILLQSRNRRVIKFFPRIVSDSTSTTVSIHDNVGAVQEVSTEGNDIVAHLEKRKMSFGVSCSECSHSFYSRIQLCLHVTSAHGIPAPVVNKVFDSEDMFRDWMDAVKQTHAVDFVHSSGSRNWSGKEQKITYLQCSRSGDQKIIPSRSVKKPRGTIKCGKTCLAYLKTTQILRHGHPWGPIKVEGCLQHSGHNIDPHKIILVPEEERAIQQLIERNNGAADAPVDINVARAILYPCARFRLITDEDLLAILPRWFWQITNDQREVAWTESELVGESEEEERHLVPQSTMDEAFEGLHHQLLEFDETDDFVSVV